MLILTRREGESLLIGDDIRVTVSGIRGNTAKIGVDAPEEVDIVRQELLEEEDDEE